jgi:N-acetylneuraminic acid mutarotase
MTRWRNIALAGFFILVLFAAIYLVATEIPCAVPAFAVADGGGEWRAGAPMPTARSELAATALDGRVYVAGGLAGLGVTDAFEVYEPVTDSWQAAADLPAPLHHTALAGMGGKVYLTGGFHDLAFQEMSDATWAYDPQQDAWEQVATMPGPRGSHAMVAVDGKLYVVGGEPDATALWVYDPATDSWQTGRAPLPTAREHLAAVALDGRLYAIGGRWSGVGNRDSLEVYDPEADRWEALPAMPSARGGLTAAALDGLIYVGGGEDPWARVRMGCTYDTVEVYDPAAGQWARLGEMPAPRHGLASAAVEGRWYVIGGATRPTAGTVISNSNAVGIVE